MFKLTELQKGRYFFTASVIGAIAIGIYAQSIIMNFKSIILTVN